jgi:adiponectin receptor
MYASLGIFAAIPLIHLIYNEIFQKNDTFSVANSVPYYLLMGICYLGGLYIYAKRCPEKYRPGHYDICGASH